VQVLDNPSGVDWVNNGPSGTGEYFLIENRQQTGYDAALPGCGVLIWHIDETRPTANNNNSVDTRRLLDLEEADNGAATTYGQAQYSAADPGDAFLGGTFGDTSAPSSDLYGGASSGASVSNIGSTCAATMSATVTGPGGGGGNSPPVLGAIGNKNATVGNQLSFQVSATDADADALTYSASNLPAGATFNPGTRTFSWTPAQAGTHPNVHFEVTDGTASDSENIMITVTGGGGGDTTPPDTFIDSRPKDVIKIKKGRKGRAPYQVSADEPATIEGRVNGGAWQGPFEPGGIEITDLRKGSYTIEFRATDTAGNVDATPASDSFTVKIRKKRRN